MVRSNGDCTTPTELLHGDVMILWQKGTTQHGKFTGQIIRSDFAGRTQQPFLMVIKEDWVDGEVVYAVVLYEMAKEPS